MHPTSYLPRMNRFLESLHLSVNVVENGLMEPGIPAVFSTHISPFVVVAAGGAGVSTTASCIMSSPLDDLISQLLRKFSSSNQATQSKAKEAHNMMWC